MDGVLNQNTKTIHRQVRGRPDLVTPCGLTAHVDAERLRRASIDRATFDVDADRCGKCFEGAGGY